MLQLYSCFENQVMHCTSEAPDTLPQHIRFTTWYYLYFPANTTLWTDYVVSMYPPPPYTIHPPHQIATILEESVIHSQILIFTANSSAYCITIQHSTTLRTGCMLFRHGTCTTLLITGISGWQWGWTKTKLVPLESSWDGVNRKSNYDFINRMHDFLFTCKVMPWYCKCLFHYAVQFGHWYLCLSLVSYSLLFSVGLFL